MGDSFQNNSHQSGVTLIELLVVILIIAVLAGFALLQRDPADQHLRRQNVAQQLKSTLERARFDSVKRRAAGGEMARVTITPTTYTLRTYHNDANGVPVADDRTITLPPGIVIDLADGTLVSTEVTFNMRGETPSSPEPHFYICNVDCSNPSNSTANFLIVTPTGTVNLLGGDADPPTFGPPGVTTIPTGTGVNPDTVLP